MEIQGIKLMGCREYADKHDLLIDSVYYRIKKGYLNAQRIGKGTWVIILNDPNFVERKRRRSNKKKSK